MKPSAVKKKVLAAICALSLVLLMGCGGDPAPAGYRDGTYVGRSSEDDQGAYGEVTLVLEGGEVASCLYVTWQADGSVKGEEYGKVNGEISNQDYYRKAQLAVEAMKIYAQQYEQVKKIEAVDVISGATNSYDQFVEAVGNALKAAAEGK